MRERAIECCNTNDRYYYTLLGLYETCWIKEGNTGVAVHLFNEWVTWYDIIVENY